jgi:hypothetical protein
MVFGTVGHGASTEVVALLIPGKAASNAGTTHIDDLPFAK